jgi:hypothetical protein
MNRSNIVLAILLVLFTGCRSYTQSTPREYFEGDNASNYRRVFKEEKPKDVTVVNSVVVGYQWRPGVVTTDDFEFEMIVPSEWVNRWKRQLALQDSYVGDIQQRKDNPIRSWYAPKDLKDYQIYRDQTSIGYVHMLVDKVQDPDGRFRVFYSKH